MAAAIPAPPKRKQTALAQACVLCRVAHTACTGTKPCRRCVSEGTPDKCYFTEPKKRGRPPRTEKKLKTETDDASSSVTSGATPSATAPPHSAARRSPPVQPAPTSTAGAPPVPLAPYPLPSSFISLFVHNGSTTAPQPVQQMPLSTSGAQSPAYTPLVPSPGGSRQNLQTQHSPSPLGASSSFTFSSIASPQTSASASVMQSAASPSQLTSPPAVDSLLSLLVEELKDLKKTVKTLQEDVSALTKRQEEVEGKVGALNDRVENLSSKIPANPFHQSSPPSSSSSDYSSALGGDFSMIASSRTYQSLGSTVDAGAPYPPLSRHEPFPSYASLHESLVIARQNIVQHFPFLADYDLSSPNTPFVVDDIRKPTWAYRIIPRGLGEEFRSPTIIYANTAYARLTGYSCHELLGMSSQKITYLEDEHKRKVIHLIYQRGAAPYSDVYSNLAFKCLRKDGRILRLHARYQIFYDATGRWQWVVSCVERFEHLSRSSEEEAKYNQTAMTIRASSGPRHPGVCHDCGTQLAQDDAASEGGFTSTVPSLCQPCVTRRGKQASPQAQFTTPSSGLSHSSRDGTFLHSAAPLFHPPPPPEFNGHARSAPSVHGTTVPHSPPPPQSPDYGGYWAM